jgi:very-short-patch-repair endonuclease
VNCMGTDRARQLRSLLTEAESFLWMHLRYRQIGGYKFRRQHPVGRYIVDFACLEKNLIIEVDGGQHAQQVEDDNARTEELQSHGFQVLRFWNNQILREIDSVKAAILEVLESK